MKPAVPVTLSLAALGMTGYAVSGLRDTVNPPGLPPGLEAHETHAGASLLGQARTTFSGWLWLRTDLYLHNGVEMRPLTESEKVIGGRGSSSTDNEDKALHDDSAITTVVPPPEHDFRGIFGDIERSTTAYKNMTHHTHNDPVSVLPLFRLMTWIDPAFIPGWTTGASVLARDRSDEGLTRALDYLGEGLKSNPNNISLNGEIGYLLVARKHQFGAGARYLERAREAAIKNSKNLTEEDLEALPEVYRWLALAYREDHLPEKMVAVLREGSHAFPDDLVLKRLLEHPQAPGADSPDQDDPDHH